MSDAPSSVPQPRSSRRNSASTVVRALIGWVLLWLGVCFVVTIFVSMIYGVQDEKPPQQVLYVALSVTTACVFAYATARRVGWDPVRLGIVPVQRRWLLAMLSVLAVLQLPAVGLLTRALSPARPRPFVYAEVVVSNVAWAKVLLIMVSVGVAPIVEELLFRGWLWADLRRYWSATSVMLFTGLAFLLVHITDDYRKPFGLLIITLLITLARQYCGSVKATIWLHILNNATIVAALLYVGTPAPLSVHLPPHQPMP